MTRDVCTVELWFYHQHRCYRRYTQTVFIGSTGENTKLVVPIFSYTKFVYRFTLGKMKCYNSSLILEMKYHTCEFNVFVLEKYDIAEDLFSFCV